MAINGTYTATKEHLYSMVQQGKVPHAQLLVGSPTMAGIPLALDFITYLHCTARTVDRSCGSCIPCKQIGKFIHPDLHFLIPSASPKGSKNKEKHLAITLESWRSFLEVLPFGSFLDWSDHLGNDSRRLEISKSQMMHIRKMVGKKPFASHAKTILVWLPEYLHPVASNALLKVVEEPPADTFFIFVTENPHKILPTLRSRMWAIYMPPMTDEQLYKKLQQLHPTANRAKLAEVAQIAQGSLSLATKVLQDGEAEYFAHFSQWLRQLYLQKLATLATLADTFHSYSYQVQKNWVSYVLQLLRISLLSSCKVNSPSHLPATEVTFCKKFSQAIPREKIIKIVEQVTHLGYVLNHNANPKLAFVNTSLTIAQLLQK